MGDTTNILSSPTDSAASNQDFTWTSEYTALLILCIMIPILSIGIIVLRRKIRNLRNMGSEALYPFQSPSRGTLGLSETSVNIQLSDANLMTRDSQVGLNPASADRFTQEEIDNTPKGTTP